MVKFAFEGYKTEFPNWSKHHKTLGTHVRRVYEDGETIGTKNEEIEAIVKVNEDKLKLKHVNLYNRQTGNRRNAKDYYLPLTNLEYEDADIDYYSNGASNTKQTTHIRFKFLIEDNLFVLSHSYRSSGHYSMSFGGFLDGFDDYRLDDIIEEILGKEEKLEDIGITKGETDDYHIVVADKALCPEDFEISKRDLFESLVAVEVYKFDMEIVDSADELEEEENDA